MTSPRSDLDAHLSNVMGAFVTSVGEQIVDAMEAEAGSGGASPPALLALQTWPGSSIATLSDLLRLTHSGTVRLVDRLVDAGYVQRGPGADGRTAALHLSRAGKEVATRLHRRRTAMLSDLLVALSHEERETLNALLDTMLRAGDRTRTQARIACRLCDHTVCVGEDCPVGASVGA